MKVKGKVKFKRASIPYTSVSIFKPTNISKLKFHNLLNGMRKVIYSRKANGESHLLHPDDLNDIWLDYFNKYQVHESKGTCYEINYRGYNILVKEVFGDIPEEKVQ